MAVALSEYEKQATESYEKSQILNQAVFQKIKSNDASLIKEAEDAVTDFTRLKIRESGFLRLILPPIGLTNDKLDRAVHTNRPLKIVDMEPDSPGSISVPLGSTPQQFKIGGQRYAVMFDRIMTPMFMTDVDELRTFDMDIRQVLSDNSIKDHSAEEDGKFMRAVDSLLVGQDVVLAGSGVAQYRSMNAPLTRDSFVDSLNVLPDTIYNIPVETILCNNITFTGFAKFDMQEFGGQMSQDVLKQGTSVLEGLHGKRWVLTIKRSLVPNGHMYHFGNPKFLGKFFNLEDITMSLKRETFMLQFFAYSYSGLTLAHPGAIAHVVFTS